MIRAERAGARMTLTLDRADKANALTLDMLEALDSHVAKAASGPDRPRVVVLTGAGTKVFSAGADLEQAKGGPVLTRHPIWGRLSDRLAALPALTIAALNGTLAGGAFGMALACDLRIATPGARFFYPVLRNGFLPQPGDLPRLKALIGPARAKLVLLAGQKIDAQAALAMGLVDELADHDAMAERLNALSAVAENADPVVLAAIKGMIGGGLSADDAFSAVYDRDASVISRLLP